ncbi:asparagine synthetase B family protein [Neosynechococcus sphagnicola]|uniref:asparagine synthetase B family protein n=1 Tax=Neosynechococcus sphagnicola TaxID=1501145 RepID=UPI000A3FE280|nr:asparagine synthase-related protein [Neosynechococcus sphagnicola]
MGGYELFGGYYRYFTGRQFWQRVGWVPLPLRTLMAAGLNRVSRPTWDCLLGRIATLVPAHSRYNLTGERMHQIARILGVDSPDLMYRSLVSHWQQPTAIVPGSQEPLTRLSDRQSWAQLPDFTQRMMFLDLVTYLPDDILTKVDRASMGVSLESRVPFLDHRVVEFAWTIPLSMKIRHQRGKWLLRQVLHRYLPLELIERPKMGFGIPIDEWLRSSLRDWAESLINPQRLQQQGFFNPAPIQEKWQQHLRGDRNWQYYLWDILMFQAWLDENQ